MKTIKRKKQFLNTMVIVGIMVSSSMMMIFMMVQEDNQELLDNGIREEAIVIKKYNTGTRKNPSYSMDIAWFTKGEEVRVYETKDTTNLSKEEKFSNDVLTQTLGDKTRFKLSDYQTFRINYINGNSYNTYSKGDIITLIYLKDQPEKGRILNEIE